MPSDRCGSSRHTHSPRPAPTSRSGDRSIVCSVPVVTRDGPERARADAACRDQARPVALDSRTGWWAVGTTFLALAVAFGFSYNFGSVVAPMRQSLGISASQAGWIFSVLPFTFLALSGVSGSLADRWGPRPML